MKRIVLVIVAVVTVFAGMAQNEEKAKEILDQVSAKTKTYNSMSAEFVLSLVNTEMDIDEKNKGKIKVKGQKYCVQLHDAGIEVFSDGTTIWNYMKDGNQVTISDVDSEGSELMDPSSIFTIYEKGFRSEFVKEKKADGLTIYDINLYPDSDEYEVSKIEVSINKSTMMIYSAILHGTDGNRYEIAISKLVTDSNFPDSDFVFDKSKYGDVEEIDFR